MPSARIRVNSHLQPYKTSPSPAIQDTSAPAIQDISAPAIRGSFLAETCICNKVEERKLNRMAKVHDWLEIWQGSQNLRATQKECCAQNKRMTAVGYISDTDETVKASWSLFEHDCAAAFKLSERSPLPPAVFEKDLPGE